jgi:signal transduction histidine kinase/CheY-like chemotaxis protein
MSTRGYFRHYHRLAPTIVVVVVAGAALSAAGFIVARGWEERYSRANFALQSENRVSVIRREIHSNLNALIAIRGLAEVAGPLTQARFDSFAARILESNPSLRAVEWLERVSDAQRQAFETQLHREGAPQPFISEGKPGGGTHAGHRAAYYPVRFLYPANSKNRSAIGFDFGTCRGCASVLETANRGDSPAATVKFRILEHTGDGYAVAVVLPVHDSREKTGPPIGYAMVLLQVADVVERAIRNFNIEGMNIQIYDQDAPPGARLLYFHSSRANSHPLPENAYRRPDGFEYQSPLKMGGRPWLVVCTPTPDYLESGRSWRPWLILAVGLLITTAVVTVVVLHMKYVGRVEMTNGLLNEQIQVRIATERELSAARDQALMASRMKSQFLATMSHEIRTPMNGVIGMTHLLLDTPLTTDQRDYAESVRVSAEALLRVINDILDLSRIEAGRIAIECSVFNLRRLIEEVVCMLAPKAREKAIVLRAEIPECLPTHFLGDMVRIRQILMNLIGNAVKFTPAGEVVVTLQCGEACPPAERAGMSRPAGSTCGYGMEKVPLKISVRDTGIGISAENLGLLFEKFSQVDSSDSRRFGGTGLGLAISKELVELLGGTMGVETVPEQGSVFWFTLPLPVAVTAGMTRLEPAAPPPHLDPGSPPRVLVAEDNPINLRVATVMLERIGIHADIAANGADAVELFRAQHHDIIFMDCQMPEMDGYAATAAIRQCQNPSRPPVIIAMTADAMEGSRDRCLSAGMDDYIAKPVKRSTLVETITRWQCPHPVLMD